MRRIRVLVQVLPECVCDPPVPTPLVVDVCFGRGFDPGLSWGW